MLSIVIPCYNCEKTINSCYESILGALFYSKIDDYEILMINDGSKDNTEKILKNITEENSKAKVISQENNGAAAARNLGIDLAKGKYISFIDSDDTIKKEFYKYYEKLKTSDIYIYICGVDRGGNEKKDGSVKIIENTSEYINKILYDLNVYGYSCNKIYRRDIIVDNNLRFPEDIRFMEDTYFNLECALVAKKVMIHNENLYNYFEQATTGFGNSETKYNGYKIWDRLIKEEKFSLYSEELKKNKYSQLIWLLGQMYAEKYLKREELLKELKDNKKYIESIIPKKSPKYIQYILLLINPRLVGYIIRKKNKVK